MLPSVAGGNLVRRPAGQSPGGRESRARRRTARVNDIGVGLATRIPLTESLRAVRAKPVTTGGVDFASPSGNGLERDCSAAWPTLPGGPARQGPQNGEIARSSRAWDGSARIRHGRVRRLLVPLHVAAAIALPRINLSRLGGIARSGYGAPRRSTSSAIHEFLPDRRGAPPSPRIHHSCPGVRRRALATVLKPRPRCFTAAVASRLARPYAVGHGCP
jgi:hypothetical protein